MPPRQGASATTVYRSSTSGSVVFLIDLVVVAWVVAWVLIGMAIARDVRNLGTLSDTVVQAGNAVRETGQALHALERLPFVGERIGRVAGQVDAAAAGAIRSGQESRESVDRLAVLLGFSVGVVPTVPILAMYIPFRISRFREVRAIRRGGARSGGDPMFEEYLAHRAVENLPYHRLREITPNPWRDLAEGRHSALADAELARLGLRRYRRDRTAG